MNDLSLEMLCPGCGEPVEPQEAFPLELDVVVDGAIEKRTMVFHRDATRMCPFVYSSRKLEEARTHLCDASAELTQALDDLQEALKKIVP